MSLNLLLLLSFNSSQTYRSHTCTLVRERRWSCFCQFGPQEMWSTGWGMSRNLWRSRWGITSTAHSESTQRSVVLCCSHCLFVLLSVLVKLLLSSFCKICLCSFGPQQPRAEWVLSWPGQVVIAGCQVFWTAEVSEALERGDLASHLHPQLQTQVGADKITWLQLVTKLVAKNMGFFIFLHTL